MANCSFFVMLKPDAVSRNLMGTIISRFEKKGFDITELKMIQPTRTLAESHYEEHRGKDFFERVVNFTISGRVVAIKMFGNIDVARRLIGDTIPWCAEPGTIRGDFANKLPQNLVHCSDSPESAIRELELWFGE